MYLSEKQLAELKPMPEHLMNIDIKPISKKDKEQLLLQAWRQLS